MNETQLPNVIVSRAKVNNLWLDEQKAKHRETAAKIGADARAARESRGLSLRDVAAVMGVSYPYLGDLEKGHRGWTTKTAQKWQAAIESFKQNT